MLDVLDFSIRDWPRTQAMKKIQQNSATKCKKNMEFL